LEDYTTRVRGEQISNVVLVTRQAAGPAQWFMGPTLRRNITGVKSGYAFQHRTVAREGPADEHDRYT
jgi:hypothetical protein